MNKEYVILKLAQQATTPKTFVDTFNEYSKKRGG